MKAKEPKPEPERLWAVYGPCGNLIQWTINKKRGDSIFYFVRHHCGAFLDHKHEWKLLRPKGYTCRRITITPEVAE